VRGRIIIRVIAEEDQVPGSGTPQLILLGGLPGPGKTILGRRVAEEIPAVRLCGDEWIARLGVDWLDEETRDRLEQLFWNLAQDLLRHGQTVILESGFWLRSDRDEKRLGARALGAAVELHYLGAPIDELCRRLAARVSGSVPISREQLEHWSTFFEAPDRAGLDLFDGPAPTGPTS
jgi:predicted kinase